MKIRQIISFIVAAIGTTAAICLESVVTPGDWRAKWHLVVAIAALNVIRLYAFYEGSVMREISEEKAQRAFKLSISLTIGFSCYGIYLKVAEESFGWHALGLFLLLQFGLAVVEWMFSERMSDYVDTEFGKQLEAVKQQFKEQLAAKDKQLSEKAQLLATVKEQSAQQLNNFQQESSENEEQLQKQFSALQKQFSEQSSENAELLSKNQQQLDQLLSFQEQQSANSQIGQLVGLLLPATQSHKLVLCTNCYHPNHIHNSKLSKHTGNTPEAISCTHCTEAFYLKTEALALESI